MSPITRKTTFMPVWPAGDTKRRDADAEEAKHRLPADERNRQNDEHGDARLDGDPPSLGAVARA